MVDSGQGPLTANTGSWRLAKGGVVAALLATALSGCAGFMEGEARVPRPLVPPASASSGATAAYVPPAPTLASQTAESWQQGGVTFTRPTEQALRAAEVALARQVAAVPNAGVTDTSASASDLRDPWEPFNRRMFAFNDAVYEHAVGPVVRGYRAVTPPFVRDRVRDFAVNLTRPASVVNSLLQGKPKESLAHSLAFSFNLLWGIGGFIDLAGEMGLTAPEEDLGQTMAVWGVPSGPYVVLPFLGPSTVRHTVGRGVEYWRDPWDTVPNNIDAIQNPDDVAWVGFGMTGLSTANSLWSTYQALRDTSLDPYIATRSAYWQARQAEINNATGGPGEDEGLSLSLDQELEKLDAGPPAGGQ